VIIIDSLFNTSISVLKQLKEITKKEISFFQLDITNLEDISKVCEIYTFDAIIHFA
jgi:UDP-glucose 4-epimerase